MEVALCLSEIKVKKKKDHTRWSFFFWLNIVDNVRTIIQKQNHYIYIPDLSFKS